MSQYVIKKPHLQNKIKRVFAFIIVLAIWFVFLHQFYSAIENILQQASYKIVLDYFWTSFNMLFIIILIPSLAILSWVLYNYFRFRYKYRHSKKRKVTDIEIYQLLAANSSPIGVVKRSKVLVAENNEDKICLRKATQQDLQNLFINNKPSSQKIEGNNSVY